MRTGGATRWIAGGGFALLACAAAAAPLDLGRQMADAFVRGEVAAVWGASTPAMQQALGSVDDLRILQGRLATTFGHQETVLAERVEQRDGFAVFVRVARWSGAAGPLETTIAFDPAGRIAGFHIRPQPVAAPSPHLAYQTRAELHLPFDGEWFVYWGGRGIEDNYHAAYRGQQFALDLLILRNGQSHAGDPARLDSYHCWETPILAPAEGVVVQAVGGLPDQAIGSADPANPAGNHVVIDFGHGEFGFLAHLRQHSLRVGQGDRVVRGQLIGLCGNSGNTTEPHLHFHLQTGPQLGTGEGLPAQFQHYVANGHPVERGEPRRGDSLRPAP